MTHLERLERMGVDGDLSPAEAAAVAWALDRIRRDDEERDDVRGLVRAAVDAEWRHPDDCAMMTRAVVAGVMALHGWQERRLGPGTTRLLGDDDDG